MSIKKTLIFPPGKCVYNTGKLLLNFSCGIVPADEVKVEVCLIKKRTFSKKRYARFTGNMWINDSFIISLTGKPKY